MTNSTIVNNQGEDTLVMPERMTNWNGEEVKAYQLIQSDSDVGDQILDEVADLIGEFVFTTEDDRVLMTLWGGHANVFDWFRMTPRMGITAGVEECGKTQALKALRLLTNNSYWLTDPTGPVFFTYTQHGDKAVFVDEMQDALRIRDGSLKTALKTGSTPDGTVPRTEMSPTGRIPKQFSTYACVAFAGIGVDRLVDRQLLSRSHWVHMRRAYAYEQREILDERFDGERFKDVGGRYLKWLHQNEQKIKAFKTSDLPPFIMNRSRQKWLPLFAIASVVGGKWMERVIKLADEDNDQASELNDGTKVLLAVQQIYNGWDRYSPDKPLDVKIIPPELSRLLAKWKDEDGFQPYAKFHKGADPDERVIRSNDLMKLLRPYVRTREFRSRFNMDDRTRGFVWGDLLDAADRHLPDAYREQSCHGQTHDKEVSHD